MLPDPVQNDDDVPPPDRTPASILEDPVLLELPATDEDLLNILTPMVTRFHLTSRPLLGLPPNAYMSERQVSMWEIEKQKTRVILQKALTEYPMDGSHTPAQELALVNAVLSLHNLFSAKLPAVKGVKQYHQEVFIQMPDGTTTPLTINGRAKEKRAERPHDIDGDNGAHIHWRATIY